MSFPIEKLPDTILEQIFKNTENDTDFHYDSKTSEMNFYFPVAHIHVNVLAALMNWLDRKSFIHKQQCLELVKQRPVGCDSPTATCECDKRVLVYSGNGGKKPLDFVRGQSEKIVVEWHSTQEMVIDDDPDLSWDQSKPHIRAMYPQVSGIAEFYEFGPITNIGALSSDYISQLDIYHGLSGKNYISYKHPILDKLLTSLEQGMSEELFHDSILSQQEKDYHNIELQDNWGHKLMAFPYIATV
jgi:hypothetical protein